MLQSLCHKNNFQIILILPVDENNNRYFSMLKKATVHLLSQIKGEREAFLDSVNFCRFLPNIRKICHEITTQSLTL